ncbi:UDP-glucose/GDP-mannose dehydrogenase family protein [Nonomuraea pusilla]|nr:UDP-glucose/GDP-mannose dehydrogenase family protein [Nonomuraea pusilla]
MVVLTDHDCFDYHLAEQVCTFIFDTRNRCRGPNIQRL